MKNDLFERVFKVCLILLGVVYLVVYYQSTHQSISPIQDVHAGRYDLRVVEGGGLFFVDTERGEVFVTAALPEAMKDGHLVWKRIDPKTTTSE